MPAPTDVLIRYLAVFQRWLIGMDEAATSNDREAMWLHQWAADLLHNVPHLLLNYGERSDQEKEHQAQTVLAFPEFVQKRNVSPRVVELARKLVSPDGTHAELDLKPNLRNLDLPPEPELEEPLEILYWVSLNTRQRRSWDLNEQQWHHCEAMGRNNGRVARAAKPLPTALVHWRTFDPDAFKAELQQAYSEVEPLP